MTTDFSENNPYSIKNTTTISGLTSKSLPLEPIIPAANQANTNRGTSELLVVNDGTTAFPQNQTVAPNNIVSTTADGMRVADLSSIPWQGNALSNYRNYTYSFTLSACGDSPPITTYKDYVAAKLSDDNRHVVIAQTASTKYNIVSCEISSMAGPGFRNGNTGATGISMTITEPLGLSFLDSLKNASQVLKIKNPSKMYYFLELSFKAYNEDGVAINKGSGGVGFDENPSDNDSGRKKYGFMLWKVLILDIDVKINEGGGTYTLKLQPQNEQAFTDGLFRLSSPTKCSGATVAEAIGSLATMLNNDVKKRYLGREVMTYKFEIMHDNLKQYVMKTDDPFGTNTSDLDQDGKPTHQAARGMTIGQMIDAIFLNSTMVKEWEDHFKNPQDKLTTAMNILRVVPDVEYGQYDPIIGDYIKTIVYRIYPYETWQPILSKEQYDGRREKSKDIFYRLANNNFITKRYDYIYTGKNSEILNFDAHFNISWVTLINVFDGARRGYAAASEAPLHNEHLAEQLYNVESQVMRGISIIENFLATQDKDEIIMDDGSKINLNQEAGEMATIRAELIDLGDQYNKGQRDQYEAKLAELEGRAKDVVEKANIIERTRMNSVLDRWATSPSGESRFKRYAEDIETRQTDDSLTPVTFFRTPLDTSTEHGSGALGDWNVGKAVMSSVLNNTYNTLKSDLQNLTLEIRGDPYWLGSSNMEIIEPNVGKSNTDFPSYDLGDHAFIATFKYPVGINDDTHEIKLDSGSSFNGLYFVRNVTHTFSGGAFKQTLDAMRSTIIPLEKVITEQPSNRSATVPALPNVVTNPVAGQSNTMLTQAIENQELAVTNAEKALQAINAEKAALQSKINIAMANGNVDLANSLKLELSGLSSKIGEQQSIISSGSETLASLKTSLTEQLAGLTPNAEEFKDFSASINSLIG